jgi:tripartite ATP-independent transporter DctM subunit
LASARRATTRFRRVDAVSWGAAAWLMLGGSTALLFLGLPVAFSFLVINLVGALLFLGGEAGLTQIVRNSVISVASFSLTPIPLFILMGEILFHTGLAVKVIDGVERLIRQVPGRLAVVAVVAGTVFSAISGSTIATTAMLGSLMLPVMLSRGYHPTMATGPLMAIGAVDMLIPPSALTVLLGSLSGISIAKLLIGGVIPGLLLSLAFIVYIVVRVKLNPSLAPATAFTEYTGWEKLRPLFQYVLPLVSIFVVVVASMSAGWATPTESAAIGALFTMMLALAYGALSFRNLLKSLRGTAAISGMILFIIVGATTFSQILSFSGVSNGLVEIIANLGLPPGAVIAAMMLLLIFLGLFVEQVSMMMITLPIYMPLVQKYGVDPVWFGVMFLICMQLGLLLPPHGLLLMTMKGVSPPEVRMSHIFRAVVPYLAMSLVLLALVFFVPGIAVWLPGLVG